MPATDWNQRMWPLTIRVNVITLVEALQGEHETELFGALEDPFYGPGRKKRETPRLCTTGTKATYESLLSKEYDCQTKYKDSFCFAGRT